MHIRFYLLTLLCGLSFQISASENKWGVGQKEFVLVDPIRNRKLVTYVWYPIPKEIKLKDLDKGPFVPVVAASDVKPVAHKFPIVLISHGSGGLAKRMFWLAGSLVKNGNVVIAVDHPGNKLFDNSVNGLMRIWDRAKDLSFALDKVLESKEFEGAVDSSKIAAVGHSAGGTTVLLLGGARFSYEKFQSPVPKCEGSKDPYVAKQCTELKSLNLRSYPKALVDGDYMDKRVKAVVALDPGFARSFQQQSLQKISSKIFVFIAEKLATPQDEIYSKEFTNFLPSEVTEIIPGSVHMTFLQPCKDGRWVRDAEMKDICGGDSHKLQNQKNVSEKIDSFLLRRWK
jgi:predicted dienelactone hydrolase